MESGVGLYRGRPSVDEIVFVVEPQFTLQQLFCKSYREAARYSLGVQVQDVGLVEQGDVAAVVPAYHRSDEFHGAPLPDGLAVDGVNGCQVQPVGAAGGSQPAAGVFALYYPSLFHVAEFPARHRDVVPERRFARVVVSRDTETVHYLARVYPQPCDEVYVPVPCHVVDAVAIDKTGEDAYRKLLRSFVREQDADVPRAEVTCRSGDFVVSFRIVTAYVGGEERAARKVVLSGATAQFRTEVVKLLTERDLEGSGGERYVGVEDTQLSFGVEVGLELIAEESCRPLLSRRGVRC